mmetsp:Transcript_43186/g.113727  ORF Transcript_43186/g.113727 Transcript_43186/m.113727 type:complete len:311 (-) Transcript_43186:2467-3399(-)
MTPLFPAAAATCCLRLGDVACRRPLGERRLLSDLIQVASLLQEGFALISRHGDPADGAILHRLALDPHHASQLLLLRAFQQLDHLAGLHTADRPTVFDAQAGCDHSRLHDFIEELEQLIKCLRAKVLTVAAADVCEELTKLLLAAFTLASLPQKLDECGLGQLSVLLPFTHFCEESRAVHPVLSHVCPKQAHNLATELFGLEGFPLCHRLTRGHHGTVDPCQPGFQTLDSRLPLPELQAPKVGQVRVHLDLVQDLHPLLQVCYRLLNRLCEFRQLMDTLGDLFAGLHTHVQTEQADLLVCLCKLFLQWSC